jgi:hypothetical protein
VISSDLGRFKRARVLGFITVPLGEFFGRCFGSCRKGVVLVLCAVYFIPLTKGRGPKARFLFYFYE